jgi:hypothetical protein
MMKKWRNFVGVLGIASGTPSAEAHAEPGDD